MNALVKKQQDSMTGDNTALLSPEIVNSLLIRYKMLMEKSFKEQKHLLRSFLIDKNLNFIQECCTTSIQKLMQLVVYYDFPMNFLNVPLNLEKVNLLQFMFEIKKRQNVETLNTEFVMNLWNMLKSV